MRRAAQLALAASLLFLAAPVVVAAPGAFGIILTGQTCTSGQSGTFLTWSQSNTATSYTVYRNGVVVMAALPPNTLRYDDNQVVAGTDYDYFVRATDGSATTDSNTRTITAPFCSAPGAFTLTATPVCAVIDGGHRPVVQLQWIAAANASKYDVYRDNIILASNFAEPTSIYDTSPDVGSSHTYFVKATGIGGETNSNSQTTSAPPSTCPAPPTAPTLTGSGSCDASTLPKKPVVNLSWTASTGATSYDIVKSGEVIQTTTATTYKDFSVAAGGSYSYVIRANNSGGSADSNALQIDLAADICGTPPGAFTVSTFAACSAGAPKVTVSWTASAGAVSYVVFRNSVAISSTLSASTLSYDDTTATIGTPYGYFVQATNDTGTTESNTSAITVPDNVCAGSAPTAPSLNGTIICGGATPKVRLTWSGATNATSYTVFRDSLVLASGLSAATSSYDDTTVATGQSHVYFVRAVNNSGSADSPTFTANSISCGNPPAAPVLAGSQVCNVNNNPVVHLTWNSVAGVTSYGILRDGVSFGQTLAPEPLSFDDATVIVGQQHTYQVRASNDTGFSDSNTVSITAVACSNSIALTASAACANGNAIVHLTWSAAAGSPTYSVRRNGSQIATTSATSYDDASVTAGQSYSYVIHADSGVDSNTANVTISSTLCSTPHPDLAVVIVTLGTNTAKPGDALLVSYSISNAGNASANASVARIRIGNTVLASVTTPSISTGTTLPFTQSVVVPSLVSGNYFVTVSADDDHTTGDVNPSNNTGSSTALQITGTGACTLSCASTAAAKGNVLQPVAFALTQAPACPGATITWRFGDGDTSSAQSPSHVFQHPGIYQWSVTVSTADSSCQNSGTIEIAPIPSRRRGVAH